MEYFGHCIKVGRQYHRLSQKGLARELTKRGLPTSNNTICNWEKGYSVPNVCEFFEICDILNISDIREHFRRNAVPTIYSGLTNKGKSKLEEYAELLKSSPHYRARDYNLRTMKVYEDLSISNYKEVRVGAEVPMNADFGMVMYDDSMAPKYLKGQILWITKTHFLYEYEVGLFNYDYKPLIAYYSEDLEYEVTKLIPHNKNYKTIIPQRRVRYETLGSVVA